MRMDERKLPENCTLCGGSFTVNGRRCLYPYPPNHYLCYNCLTKSMDEGLGKLNKELAEGNLDLSVEEIADIIKPEDHNDEAV